MVISCSKTLFSGRIHSSIVAESSRRGLCRLTFCTMQPKKNYKKIPLKSGFKRNHDSRHFSSTPGPNDTATNPSPWIYKYDGEVNGSDWTFPNSIAISRTWKDVDAFSQHLLNNVASSLTPSLAALPFFLTTADNAIKHIFIEIKMKHGNTVTNNNNVMQPAYEYIIFGTLDMMMIILHGYPKLSPDMASFHRLLKLGSIYKLHWSTTMHADCTYKEFCGVDALPKCWVDLSLLMRMLDIEGRLPGPDDTAVDLPGSFIKYCDGPLADGVDNVDLWKRNVAGRESVSAKLLPTASKIAPEGLKVSISKFFKKISLFRDTIRLDQPDLLKMGPEEEKSFKMYYADELLKKGQKPL